ncbi:ImmA/IrrE family metallo-endopeptidase [Nannocystaceae bacterium ST9]
MTDSNSFSPDWISPPGDTIEDLLEERGWTKAEFALRTGFTAKHVNELLKGRVPITADAAERFSRVLGSTPEFWLVREARYQAALARRKTSEVANDDAGWLKELPLAWMRKKKWVKTFEHRGEQVKECLSFFEVASVSIWRECYAAPVVAFRASAKFEKKVGAIASWLRKGEIETQEIECKPFDKVGLKETLTDLRVLTREEDPGVFGPKLVELCAANGVAVAFVPAPPGCPVSGATRWLTADKAMLLLSLRHRSNDHLWFSLFHEIGHLLLHGKKLLFIEGLDGLDDEHETEANLFAGRVLISDQDVRRLHEIAKTSRVLEPQIAAFAVEIGVAPGIVVGRMQKEGWLTWQQMNGLKVRYEWAGNEE